MLTCSGTRRPANPQIRRLADSQAHRLADPQTRTRIRGPVGGSLKTRGVKLTQKIQTFTADKRQITEWSELLTRFHVLEARWIKSSSIILL